VGVERGSLRNFSRFFREEYSETPSKDKTVIQIKVFTVQLNILKIRFLSKKIKDFLKN